MCVQLVHVPELVCVCQILQQLTNLVLLQKLCEAPTCLAVCVCVCETACVYVCVSVFVLVSFLLRLLFSFLSRNFCVILCNSHSHKHTSVCVCV